MMVQGVKCAGKEKKVHMGREREECVQRRGKCAGGGRGVCRRRGSVQGQGEVYGGGEVCRGGSVQGGEVCRGLTAAVLGM